MDGRLLGQWSMPRGTTTLTLELMGVANAVFVLERTPEDKRPERRKFVVGPAW